MSILSPAEKDAVSHRGRALRLLVPALRELAGEGLPILGKVEGAALTDDDVRRLRDDPQR